VTPRESAYTRPVRGNAGGREVCRAELVASLSLAVDIGYGQPMEHMLRSSRIALGLGRRLRLDASQRAVVYYVGLLACVGCSADAHEQARWFGDDIEFKADYYEVDMVGLSAARWMVRHVGAGEPPLRRARVGFEFLADGRREASGMAATHCFVAGWLAERLGLGAEVSDCLQQAFERWDGKGDPQGLAGEQVALPARLVRLARVVEVFHRAGGVDDAIAVAHRRSGTQFDPGLVDLFCDEARSLFEEVESATSWDALIAAEPALGAVLAEEEFDAALEAIGDYADLKSPYTLGRSRGVAELAEAAARRRGLPDADVVTLRRAAVVEDLGRLGVSNAIWDKPGPLTPVDWERVRLHPYLTERMLASSAALAPLAAIAAQHHERLDGSGYPHGLSGGAISPAARILAAADVYHAATEPRPHRPARAPAEAAAELRAEVRAGRIDGDAADAVLAVAGHRVGPRGQGLAGLTTREVEVLRLLARGLSNREIAARLVISRKTASSHVEHIYAKVGVSSRAAASLFAVRHGLLPEQVAPAGG
jgi:HD-GYP domain-containing protein (c-di-GMP phosphodiesterase class II)